MVYVIEIKGLSKVLICGGDITDNCEVISLESSVTTCKDPPNLPATIFVAIGGLGVKENPFICGGIQNGTCSNKCYSLENNEWVSYGSMITERSYAAAALLQNGKLLVTGGSDGSAILSSAEMLTEDGWGSNIPPFPFLIHEHCMVAINSTTTMIIGGCYYNPGKAYLVNIFYFTLGTDGWTEGPALNYPRRYHSCGHIRRDKEGQELSIIVAGGNCGQDIRFFC
jgi:hypothetical protein